MGFVSVIIVSALFALGAAVGVAVTPSWRVASDNKAETSP